ncbi:MAG: WecB/TagA/CpsF family glycosyltransferase [Melioribacteraceae bacterium]
MELFNKLILSRKDLINFTLNKLFKSKGILLTYFDFNAFNHVINNDEYYLLLQNDFFIYQDGIGMFLALNYLRKDVKRITSTDYYNWLIQKLIKTKRKIFLIGYDFNKEFVENKCCEKNLCLAGYHHGFFNKYELQAIINEIKVSNAEFVLVGMGKPKQEFIAAVLKKHLPQINCICVGDFFSYYFGIKKRAPKYIQNLQLEWLYRAVKESNRLFYRYFTGIPLFLFYLIAYRGRNIVRGLNYERI